MKSLPIYINERLSTNKDNILLHPNSIDELVDMIKELMQVCEVTRNKVLNLNCIDVSTLPGDFTKKLFSAYYDHNPYINLNDTNIEEIDISSWKIDSIGHHMFFRCFKLKNVIIPDPVTEIGGAAFYCCSDLKNIVIPNSVTEIGKYAFNGCDSLESIIIPNSVTSINWDAFGNCPKLTIAVPNKDIKELVENSGFNGKIIIK